MPLVVETGAGLTNSNSYIDVADATEILSVYADAATFWTPLDSGEQESLLQEGRDYLDSKFRFYGQVLNPGQALQWPRTKNYDSHGLIINPGTIPVEIQKANALLAMYWKKEDGLFNTVEETGLVKKFGTEGLDVDFDSKTGEAAAIEGKRFPEIELLLKNLGEFKDINWFKQRKTDARVTP